MSSSFHAATDGQTEVVNQTLETYLRLFISPQLADWTSGSLERSSPTTTLYTVRPRIRLFIWFLVGILVLRLECLLRINAPLQPSLSTYRL
jgi:hypothetical protein